MNIIIPIGGLGERFKQDGFLMPKPLVNFLGKPIIFWLIDNLNIPTHTVEPANITIHIPYHYELDKFNFCDKLRQQYPYHNIKFYRIDFTTRGAAETVYVALNNFTKEQLEDKVLILDSDTFYEDDIVTQFSLCKHNCIFYFIDNEDKPIYSYIKTIENGSVVDIAEKEKISNYANCGAYGFIDGKVLKIAIEDIIELNHKSKNEFYISNIYERLIEKFNIIKSIKVEKFVCLGTPELLRLACFKYSHDLNTFTSKRFCFDLDNTLVTYPTKIRDYTTVLPIQKNINFVNFLASLGHTIIIHTARRMKTHNGNTGKVIADIGKVTFDTLQKFNIKHHEVYFGKPYADFYIDDNAVNIFDNVDKFTGFYDLNIPARKNNTIEYTDTTVIKRSNDLSGLKHYYENIPHAFLKFYPSLIKATDTCIEMQRIDGITLSQLFVNNCLQTSYIDKIFDYFNTIHIKALCVGEDMYANHSKKLKERISQYKKNSVYSNAYLDEANQVILYLESYENDEHGQDRGRCGIIHGDPVFTNIIIDKNNHLKFIDMRGKLGDKCSIYGDIFYDYAKVYQSLLGYDEILHGKYANKEYKEELIKYFEQKFTKRYFPDKLTDLKWLTKSLVLSLIPIHNEKFDEYLKLAKSII